MEKIIKKLTIVLLMRMVINRRVQNIEQSHLEMSGMMQLSEYRSQGWNDLIIIVVHVKNIHKLPRLNNTRFSDEKN